MKVQWQVIGGLIPLISLFGGLIGPDLESQFSHRKVQIAELNSMRQPDCRLVPLLSKEESAVSELDSKDKAGGRLARQEIILTSSLHDTYSFEIKYEPRGRPALRIL